MKLHALFQHHKSFFDQNTSWLNISLLLLFKTIVTASVPSGSWGIIFIFIYIQRFYDQKVEKGTIFPVHNVPFALLDVVGELVGNKPAADVRLLQPIKCNLWKDPRFCAITHVAVCNYPCTRGSFTADQVSISTSLEHLPPPPLLNVWRVPLLWLIQLWEYLKHCLKNVPAIKYFSF